MMRGNACERVCGQLSYDVDRCLSVGQKPTAHGGSPRRSGTVASKHMYKLAGPGWLREILERWMHTVLVVIATCKAA